MPTENRSSNTEMVSVQATIESLEEAYAGDSALEFMNDAAQLLRQFMSISTLQHQGEPVALKCWSCKAEFTLKERADCDGCCWKCGVEIDLEDYADKFAGEVERLRAELETLTADRDAEKAMKAKAREQRDRVTAQLAERDALLRAWLDMFAGGLKASPLELLESRTLAALSASAEPSAPVDLDERAAFEKGYHKDALHRDGDEYSRMAVQMAWEGWQARAALDRKHS
ncbi:hypothetical protein WCE03_16620 [Pseudomonas guariconensis]|uniref:hypothetical protein n=1 Tax=Pseudomonas guariconensis TaxID=1288410 RepID=UPI0034D42AA2